MSDCVVIDPSLDVEQYEDVAASHGWTITHVLDTHLHADHISGARELVARSGATLLLSPSDPFHFDFEPLTDGRRIELAHRVELTVSAVSVPGHTEGSTMYQLGTSAIFTGDTLVPRERRSTRPGRPGRGVRAQSLSESARAGPAAVGHHDGLSRPLRSRRSRSTRVSSSRDPWASCATSLPALVLDETDFVAWAVANVKDRPPNYQRIVRINAGQRAAGRGRRGDGARTRIAARSPRRLLRRDGTVAHHDARRAQRVADLVGDGVLALGARGGANGVERVGQTLLGFAQGDEFALVDDRWSPVAPGASTGFEGAGVAPRGRRGARRSRWRSR